MQNRLFTIGYEDKTPAELVAVLAKAGVERVVDVRARPSSRKRGFSKTALGEALAKRGIEYVNVRAAGNPYRALKDEPARCLPLYARHLERHPEILTETEVALEGKRCALLCLEASHEVCHRSVLADRWRKRRRGRRVEPL